MDNIERAVNDMKHGNPQCASVLELLTNEVSEIKKQLTLKATQIVHLTNCVNELSDRVLQLERYSRKDCLTFNNFPYASHSADSIQEQVLQFINNIFNAHLTHAGIKACHFLRSGIAGQLSVIIKIVYFEDKNFIWRSQSLLYGITNKSNNKCLPEKDREVLKYATVEKTLKFQRTIVWLNWKYLMVLPIHRLCRSTLYQEEA